MKLFVFLFVGLCCVGFVSAVTYEQVLNFSDLPFNDEVSLIVNSNVSSWLFLNSSELFVDHVDNFSFGNNTVGELLFLVNVSNFSVGNYSQNISVFNNLSNKTSFFDFFVSVLNDSVSINYTPYIQLGINEYEYSYICDWSLPKSFEKVQNVRGNPFDNFSVNVSGQDFLRIKDFNGSFINFSFDENGEKNVFFESVIPDNISVGYYVDYGFVMIGNLTFNVSFMYDVVDCLDPFDDFGKDLEACDVYNKSSLEWEICYWDVQKVRAEFIRKQLLEANQTKVVVNQTIKEVSVKEYVPVIELESKDDFLNYALLSGQFSNLSVQVGLLSEQLAMKDKELLRVPELVDVAVGEYVRENERRTEELLAYKSRVLRGWVWFFVFVFLFVGFIGGFRWWSKNKVV